jgi:hypothetical protein
MNMKMNETDVNDPAVAYSEPEQIRLPDGNRIWFFNQYRYNRMGDKYVHTSYWYKHEGHCKRWHRERERKELYSEIFERFALLAG